MSPTSHHAESADVVGGRINLSTHLDRDGQVRDSLDLRPDEGVVIG
jgi:hypothetical protein